MTSYIDVNVLGEHGYCVALQALALNRGGHLDRMPELLRCLAGKGGGHDKVLEMISVWVLVDAPRHWWQEMATYRVGTCWSSESTMWELRHLSGSELLTAKDMLPEGRQQKRIGWLNYQSLRRIYHQRKNHKLKLWGDFLNQLMGQIEHRELIEGEKNNEQRA